MVLLGDFLSAISAALAVSTVDSTNETTGKNFTVNVNGIDLTNVVGLNIGAIDHAKDVDLTIKGIDLTKGLNLTLGPAEAPDTRLDASKQQYCHDLRKIIFESQTSNDSSGYVHRLQWRPEKSRPSGLNQRMKDVYGHPTFDWLCDASAQDVVDACGLAAMGVSADDLDGASWKGLSTIVAKDTGHSCQKATSTSDGTASASLAKECSFKRERDYLLWLALLLCAIMPLSDPATLSWLLEKYNRVMGRQDEADRIALAEKTRCAKEEELAKEQIAERQRQLRSLWEAVLAKVLPFQYLHAHSKDEGARQTCGAAKPDGEADLVVVDDVRGGLKEDCIDDFEIVESERYIRKK